MFESLTDINERQAAEGLAECGARPVERDCSGSGTAPTEYVDEPYAEMVAAILPLLIGLVLLLWLVTK